MSTALTDRQRSPTTAGDRYAILRELERKVLWLASWTIHNANHLRPNPDGLKVGGHQASCASVATLMTALYLDVLRPEDRVAVKPHASPVFHAIQYLLGNQTRDKLARFRGMGGAQSYPSRTKDSDDVDFSTGSVGLGVAKTAFASLVQDYVAAKGWLPDDRPPGRMVALVGDAELDEGNVYECMLEGWKQDVRNLWWVIDYNRQSLDAVVTDRLFGRFSELFSSMGWRVETLKYGKRLQAVFEQPGGEAIKRWIDDCPNSLYSALVFKGGAAWREHLEHDLATTAGVKAILDEHHDEALAGLMTNLAGHDMQAVLEAFHRADDDRPTCFIAYTIKGFGLPFAGHKDNHAGLMSVEQMEALRARHRVGEGEEWEPFAGLDLPEETLREFLASVPFAQTGGRRHQAPAVAVPEALAPPPGERLSTQESFGRILGRIGRDGGELADRVITTSPDVTVSTNLGGWVNRRGIFSREAREDVFKKEKVASFQQWGASPAGQHIELGIAENNLFLLLGALGLSHSLFGVRLLPIGTVYDPFIERGLDALNYACYQEARFLVVATPSGISLAPEGGAHQSIATPMIGIAQDGLAAFEPAYADELAVIMRWAFDYMQRSADAPVADGDLLRDASGGAVYLRLSTRGIEQPERKMDGALSDDVIRGGYWMKPPAPGARLAVVYTGAVAQDAVAAHRRALESCPEAGLLAVTSAQRLHRGWQAAQAAPHGGAGGMASARAHVEQLLAPLDPDARLVTVVDGHPGTLAWLGSVSGHRVHPLGVERFGQSGTIAELYRHYGIDAEAIVHACTAALESVRRAPRRAEPRGDHARVEMSVPCPTDALIALEEALGDGDGDAPGAFDLLVKIAARALAEVPALHGARDETGGRRRDADVAIAVVGEDGVLTPVIRGAGAKRLSEIAAERRGLTERAGAGNVRREELEGGALTVSDRGPDVAEGAVVLSVDDLSATPAATLTLSVDPRLADESTAAEYLRHVERLAADPRRLLL